MSGRGDNRWSNVPAPEPHLAGLLGALPLELAGRAAGRRRGTRRTRASRQAGRQGSQGATRAAGVALLAGGVAFGAAAVRAAGEVDLAHPGRLVARGPYGVSRNPMYVAWHLCYAGAAMLAGSRWAARLFPAVVLATHLVIRCEERALEQAFGEAYRAYRERVPRYL